MSQQLINTGLADKGNGDPIRTAFTKVNENFAELYNSVSAVVVASATAPTAPAVGDLWWNSVDGRMYVYYSSAWVDASPVDGAGISSTNELVNGASSFSVSSDGTLTLTHPAEPNFHPLSTILTIQKAAGNYHTISGAYGLSLQATPVPSGYGLNTNTNFVDIFHDGVSVNVNDNTWGFGTDGTTKIPNDSTIRTQDWGSFSLKSDNANIVIMTDVDNSLGWTFGTDGALTLPPTHIITAALSQQVGTIITDIEAWNWHNGTGNPYAWNQWNPAFLSLYNIGDSIIGWSFYSDADPSNVVTITARNPDISELTFSGDLGSPPYVAQSPDYVPFHGNPVVIQTQGPQFQADWTFGSDGKLTLPTGGAITSPDCNFSFNKDTGNFALPTLGTVISSEGLEVGNTGNSEVYMGSGFGEFRSIYNNNSGTESGLTYAGVEGFNYVQHGDVNFSGIVSQTPNIDSMYSVGLNESGQIVIGFTQNGQTQESTDWSVTVGTLNTDMTVNGLFANTTTTVIGSGLSSWTFANDGKLTLPAGSYISETTPIQGFVRTKYAGSSNGDVNYFTTATLIETSIITTLIESYDDALVGGADYSFQYVGYFNAPVTGLYTFTLYGDDYAKCWIGDNAIAGYTSENSSIYTGYNSNNFNTIELTANNFYPIRIQCWNSSGPGYFSFSWAGPDGGPDNNFTGVIYTAIGQTEITAISRPIVLNTNNIATDYQWTFGTDGALTLPGDETITDTKVTNWDTAYTWGDHSQAGYLTSVPVASESVLGGVKLGEGFSIAVDNKVTTNKLYSTNATQPTQHYRLELDTNGVVVLPDQSIINGSTLRGVYGTGDANYTGITIGPDAAHREESWMYVDHTGAYIATKYNTNQKLWQFDNNGVTTFPGSLTVEPNNNSPIFRTNNDFNIITDGTGYTWTFDSSGSLTFPNASTFNGVDFVAKENDELNLTILDSSAYIGVKQSSNLTEPAAYMDVYFGKKSRIRTTSLDNQTEYDWYFNPDGSLALPGGSYINESTTAAGSAKSLDLEIGYNRVSGDSRLNVINENHNGYNNVADNILVVSGFNPITANIDSTWVAVYDNSIYPINSVTVSDGNANLWWINIGPADLVIPAEASVDLWELHTPNTWSFGTDGTLTLPSRGKVGGDSTQGLTREIYAGYPYFSTGTFADTTAWFNDGRTPTNTSVVNPATFFWNGLYDAEDPQSGPPPNTSWKLTGYFIPPVSGVYDLIAACNDHGWVSINGVNSTSENQAATTTLTENIPYPLTVYFTNTNTNGTLNLQWKNRSTQLGYTGDFAGLLFTNMSVEISASNGANWTFGGEGTLTLPEGSTITDNRSFTNFTAGTDYNSGSWGGDAVGFVNASVSLQNELSLLETGDFISITTVRTGTISTTVNAVYTGGAGGSLTVAGPAAGTGDSITNITLLDRTASGIELTTHSNTWTFGTDGELSLPAGGDVINSTGVSQLANRVEGSWTVTAGTNTYSFTVPMDGTYTMWVKGNIPNGIITWNATLSITNNNVPAIGTQYAWNYTGGGSPILLTTIPDQIRGSAGTISTDATYVGTTSNRFDFGISNTSGSSQTIYYGYIKI